MNVSYTRMSTLVSSWLGSALWKYLKMIFQVILVQRKIHRYFRKPASIRAPSWKKSHGSGLQLWGNDEVSRTVMSSATFTTTMIWFSPNLAQYQHHCQSFWCSRSSLSIFSVSWTFLRVPFLDSCKWSSEGLYHDINVLTFFFLMLICIWVQASFPNMLFEKMAFSGSGGTSSFQLVHLQSLSVLDQISLFQLVRIQINFVWHPVLQLLK